MLQSLLLQKLIRSEWPYAGPDDVTQVPNWHDAGPNVLMQVLGCSDAGPRMF